MLNTKIQKRLINISMALTPIHRCHRCTHIAFLIKHNTICHIGFNKLKTHPLLKLYPKYSVGIHAELDVIMKSGLDDLSDYTLVVIRINRNNEITMSKPCKSCQSVIKMYNIYDVYYTNYDGHFCRL